MNALLIFHRDNGVLMKYRNLVVLTCALITSTALEATKLEGLSAIKLEQKTLSGNSSTNKESIIEDAKKPLKICKGFPICQEKIEVGLEQRILNVTNGQELWRV